MTFRPSAVDFLRGTDARRGTTEMVTEVPSERKIRGRGERGENGRSSATKRDLFYRSNDQEASRELAAATERRECNLPGEAMEPYISTFVFPFFLTYGRGRERKREEGDSQQDRRTRYAAKAWSVDKIASSWNEDMLKKR